MKTKLLMGAVAALLYGGVALAENKDCPPGYDNKDTQASLDAQAGDQSLSVIETEPVPVDESISGQEGMEQDLIMDSSEGVGGSGTAGVNAQGDIVLRCQPVKSGTGTGGSGSFDESYIPPDQSQDVGAGGSGYQTEPLPEPQVTPPAEPVPAPAEPMPPPSGAFAPIEEQEMEQQSTADMRGLTLMVGGGLEGYTGALAPNINPGPSYGVTAAIKPSRVLGLELGYSGAVNSVDSTLGDLVDSDGPDLVRNGGKAVLTVGLTAAPLQPYLLGGIGVDDYNFRGAVPTASGFNDDTVGNVPVGVGLRTHIGHFTADLRANYDFLFDQDFLFGVDDFNENGRYGGTLNIGGTF